MTSPKPIVVITGEFSGRRVERLERLGWGRCYVGRKVYRYDAEPWIFDNSAFVSWNKAGKPVGLDAAAWSEIWDAEAYQKRLDQAWDRGTPSIAVVPDIVASGPESLELSKTWLRKTGLDALPYNWPWFLAVQDGMSPEAVEAFVVENNAEPRNTPIAGLFLGGTQEFKDATAADWAALAHSLGLRAHYGRAGSVKRLKAAIAAGFDSCDSALILWTERKFQRQAKAWLELTGQADTNPALYAWVLEGLPLDAAWSAAWKADALEAEGHPYQPTRFVPPGYTYQGQTYVAGPTDAWAHENGLQAVEELPQNAAELPLDSEAATAA